MNPVLIGQMTGGLLAVIVLSMLLEAALFRNLFDDPVMGKGFSVFAAWILASIIWGLNSAGWQGINPNGFWIYGIPAVPVLAWYIYRGFKLRNMQAELEAGLDRPFDQETARTFD